jgi:hypothetical protein
MELGTRDEMRDDVLSFISNMTVRLWELFQTNDWVGEDPSCEEREGSVTRLRVCKSVCSIDWQHMI